MSKKVRSGDFSGAKKIQDDLVGRTVTNPIATSTSDYATTEGFGSLPVQFIFKTPAKAKAVDITELSAYGGGRSAAASFMGGSASYESEVLFKPGMRYKIDRVDFSQRQSGKKQQGQIWITATVLPQDMTNSDESTFPFMFENPIDKYEKISKLKISSISTQNADYGVKGMKWGKRKTNCIECRNELKSRLSNGELSKTLNEKKQSKHDASSERYKQEIAKGNHPSVVTASKEKQKKLIEKYTEEGIAVKMPNGSIRVYFEDDEIIGIATSQSGKNSVKTNCGFIHYSKDGAHIVPAMKETDDE